jgi:outer membrane lipoprotein
MAVPLARRPGLSHRPPPLLPPLVVALVLTGCATSLPPLIANPPPTEVDPWTVGAEPERHAGAQVRWGGTIVAVENRAGTTDVEVVSRPLGSNGRPDDVPRSGGRFIAAALGFLDPALYAPGAQLTVAGTVEGTVVRPIGEYPYRFPVVRVEALHLWTPLAAPVPQHWQGPIWYPDPFWPGPCRWYPGTCW